MDLFFSPLACSMSARIAFAEAGAAVNLVEVDPQSEARRWRPARIIGRSTRSATCRRCRLDDGTVLTENAAILQFIADAHPAAALAPPRPIALARAKLRQWLSFIGTELHKG